jgi:DNA-binding NarL/FixJ family response regulator
VPIRVLLADDHPIVLAGVRAMIETEPGMYLVGQATNGTAALELLADTRPDVAVFDISMPDIGGNQLTRSALETRPSLRVLILTVHEDRAYVRQMLAAGAAGYLLKRSAADNLPRAIRAVASGGLYVDPAIASQVLMPVSSAPGDSSADLSDREEAVLQMTARGYSNKEIATRFTLSVKTVETYRARATEKLGLRTRAEIVRHAAARGWLRDIP